MSSSNKDLDRYKSKLSEESKNRNFCDDCKGLLDSTRRFDISEAADNGTETVVSVTKLLTSLIALFTLAGTSFLGARTFIKNNFEPSTPKEAKKELQATTEETRNIKINLQNLTYRAKADRAYVFLYGVDKAGSNSTIFSNEYQWQKNEFRSIYSANYPLYRYIFDPHRTSQQYIKSSEQKRFDALSLGRCWNTTIGELHHLDPLVSKMRQSQSIYHVSCPVEAKDGFGGLAVESTTKLDFERTKELLLTEGILIEQYLKD